MACPSIAMTEQEWVSVGNDYLVVCAVCFTLLFWVLANNFFILKKKANGFIVSGVVTLLVQFLVRLIVMGGSPRDGTDVCSSNATYYDRYDPDHEGWSSCMVFASADLLGNCIMLYIVSVLNAEMWFKIRYGMKDIQLKTHKLVIRGGLAILITAWIFAFMFGANVNVAHTNHFCAFRAADIMEHFWSYDFPVILIVGTIVLVDIALAYTMIKMSSATGGNSFGKIWKSYKYIFGLMLSFVISWCFVIAFFNVDVFLIEYDSYVVGTTEYMDCLFDHFVSEDNHEYLDICGDRPAVRYPLYGHYLLMCVYMFVAFSHLIINYWSAAVSKFYLGLLDVVFQSSIATRLMPKSTYESRYESKLESKLESSVEIKTRKMSVSVVIAPQLKNSKVVPVDGTDDEQCTHRSDDSVSIPVNKREGVDAIREVDESGRTVTNCGNVENI